ncbi:unnamed protein product [Urochloa decumbens]|uniref:F-box domain-containing protein n=1 Tax=Urochloa decumbens TaxID=240449 RepID=A0ABC8WD02_9POAL
MMDRSQLESLAGGDHLSRLEDRVLGNILSFLPANEAARAALLSSRWRHVFAAVHTLSLEEPERLIPNPDPDSRRYSNSGPSPDPRAPPPFSVVVSAAIIARHQRRRRDAAPLRALRVATETYRAAGDSSTVDQWVSYAVHQAAPDGLDLGLRLRCRLPLCRHPYALRRVQYKAPDNVYGRAPDPDMVYGLRPLPWTPGLTGYGGHEPGDDDNGSVVSSDDDEPVLKPWQWVEPQYTVPRLLFSCAELRSLSLGSCRLALPDTFSLPSLVTLLLSHVTDAGADVERLVAGCPRLADLTLEACDAVTALSVLGSTRLRRLALRCCHKLAAVAVDSSQLQAFEYRGAVPDATFLTLHGGAGMVAYCKVDICGAEATSEEELTNLRRFLQLFMNAKHLHLESARLGSGFDKDVPTRLPAFSSLRHLEMRGCLPDYDTGVMDAMSRILEHAPNLEVLSLAFHPQAHSWGGRQENSIISGEELLDAHHLSYDHPYSVVAMSEAMIPTCLKSRVREINLVHYHGGSVQRALAKFLLRNAPAVDKMWCEFAEGPMWTQVQLMREIKGWLINKSATTRFA